MKYFCALIFAINSLSVCIHDETLTGYEIKKASKHHKIFIKNNHEQFFQYHPNMELSPKESYSIQYSQNHNIESHQGYNDRYLEYYTYSHMINYLKNISSSLNEIGYSYKVIGKSLENRNLYHLFPKKFSKNKKTILMFGRHHGDEGTANWIIEGFLNRFIKDKSFREEYQLILYPMVNPDGAENRTRYNANGRDLNRVWDQDPTKSHDEVRIIQSHFRDHYNKTDLVLDMHGSFYEDFIYRVDEYFNNRNYYNTQQSFIDTLSSYDSFQNGNFQVSNGHRKMARIYFIRNFNVNSLTHETPRDIRKNGKRSIKDLKSQGEALIETIFIEL